MDGVVWVKGLFGVVTVYHVKGAVFEDGRVCVLHGSGHVFKGNFEDEDRISGVLTTAKGSRLELEADRVGPKIEKKRGEAPERARCGPGKG